MSRHASSSIPLRLASLALPAALLLCGCSLIGVGKKGPSTLDVTIEGGADCNNCGSGDASALKYRVFTVADSAAIKQALNKNLEWGKQLEAAGTNVIATLSEDFVDPSGSKAVTATLDPKATALVVAGNFCKRSGSSWYLVYPAHPKKKGPLHVMAGKTGFTFRVGK